MLSCQDFFIGALVMCVSQFYAIIEVRLLKWQRMLENTSLGIRARACNVRCKQGYLLHSSCIFLVVILSLPFLLHESSRYCWAQKNSELLLLRLAVRSLMSQAYRDCAFLHQHSQTVITPARHSMVPCVFSS